MRTLRNAVAAGTPAHAYLFTGPRGTGKTSTGRILAKAVNCLAPVEGEPDDTCVSCRAFAEGRALDLIELDAASNRGIDEVRALRESVGYSPNAATYKVYLVDEVHMLTDAAFNALLKTLEEPPAHVIFVLATTEPHRIPPTISSRCQRFDFRRIALSPTVEQLQLIAAREGIEVADGGMELIARQASGSLRDAVNLLDQLAAYHGAALDIEAVRSGLGLVVDDRAAQLARAAVERDLAGGLALLAAVRDDGIEVRAFVREVVQTLRTVLMLRAGAREELELSDGQLAELSPVAEAASATDIVAALSALGEVDFAGDNYDALPAEIAFAAHAVGLPAERDALAPPLQAAEAPAPAAGRRPPRRRSARHAHGNLGVRRSRHRPGPHPRRPPPPARPRTGRPVHASGARRPTMGRSRPSSPSCANAARRSARTRAPGTAWRARCSVRSTSSRASRETGSRSASSHGCSSRRRLGTPRCCKPCAPASAPPSGARSRWCRSSGRPCNAVRHRPSSAPRTRPPLRRLRPHRPAGRRPTPAAASSRRRSSSAPCRSRTSTLRAVAVESAA